MCIFGGKDDPEPIPAEAPAEVLEQEAPKKKTKKNNDLSIGSKKYASPSSTASSGYPSVSQ